MDAAAGARRENVEGVVVLGIHGVSCDENGRDDHGQMNEHVERLDDIPLRRKVAGLAAALLAAGPHEATDLACSHAELHLDVHRGKGFGTPLAGLELQLWRWELIELAPKRKSGLEAVVWDAVGARPRLQVPAEKEGCRAAGGVCT